MLNSVRLETKEEHGCCLKCERCIKSIVHKTLPGQLSRGPLVKEADRHFNSSAIVIFSMACGVVDSKPATGV